MKIRSFSALLAACGTLTACDGLREAFTAHVDVAARAEERELSVTRLSDLLGTSSIPIPVNRETAMIVADLWVNYQLLGVSAARGDTTFDAKLIDDAARGITSNVRLRRFMESVSQTMKPDSANEATYTQAAGDVFVARHILFPVQRDATPQQRDSVRRRAESVRAGLTTANFAAQARRHSSDPGSAQQGGNLGAFKRTDMVKPFGDAVAALRPGEISGLVETNYGYHIIQRPTYADAKAQYDPAFAQGSSQRAESVYVAKVDADANITVKSNAASAAKAAARDLGAARGNDDVLATFDGGELTVGTFAQWVESFPPQMRITQQMAQAPDSLVRQFVKSIARNEVLLRKADSAGITMSADETQQLHGEFRSIISALWQQLGVDPAQLADSARSAPERERLAATRVESYLDKVMAGQAQPISVPLPVQSVLRAKYEWKTHPAGVDRSVERASKLRASADSAAKAQQPKSQVPMPAPRDTGASGGAPRP